LFLIKPNQIKKKKKKTRLYLQFEDGRSAGATRQTQ
jgi:hypothetical protein